MKRNIIAAAILSFASIAAMASPLGNKGGEAGAAIGGAAAIGAEATVGQINGNVSAVSQSQGNAVSATRVNGNGFSSQSTLSVGNSTATGNLSVTPTGVAATTDQTSFSNVVSRGVATGQTPALDADGYIVNGTAGVSQVTTTANASVNENVQGIAGQVGVAGFGGVAAVGGVSGW